MSQWNIGCVGSPTQTLGVCNVDFMLFILFFGYPMGTRFSIEYGLHGNKILLAVRGGGVGWWSETLFCEMPNLHKNEIIYSVHAKGLCFRTLQLPSPQLPFKNSVSAPDCIGKCWQATYQG